MKNVADVYKLSPRQRALLSAQGGAAAFDHVVARCAAPLDATALAAAQKLVFERHTALRTAIFHDGLKEPVQVVRKQVTPVFTEHPLPGAAASPQWCAALLAADRRRGMSLSTAPLARLGLAQGARGGALWLTYHPIALDALSAAIVLREILEHYQAARAGRELTLEKPRPFRDHLTWLERQDTRAAERFSYEPPGAAPPPDRSGLGPAPGDGAAVLSQQQILLSATATAAVQALLRLARIGLATVLHGAFALLAARTASDPDLRVGALVTGRAAGLPHSDGMVGPFAGVLPRRLHLAAGGTLRRALRGLEAELAEARTHEPVALGQVHSAGLAGGPCFHHLLGLDPLADDEPLQKLARELGLFDLRHLPSHLPAPLTVTAAMGPRLALRFAHDPRRWPAPAVARLAADLAALIETMAADPDQDLAALTPPPPLSASRSPLTPAASAGPPPDADADADAVTALLRAHPQVHAATTSRPDGQTLVARVTAAPEARRPRGKPLDFSLFYFADAGAEGTGKYRLYLEGAKFADSHDFAAVWTPERHFHPNGGLYPNPSLLSAALAAITTRIGLRAGSVVLPLHHPLRVAEEWSVVDNLSGGRVGLSVASGWVPNDFALAPGAYPQRRERMFELLDEVQRLWRGEAHAGSDGAGNPTELRIHPRPLQPTLPIWLTAAGNPDTFEQAGARGANVLTSLLAQPLDEAAQKIDLYRAARARAGHDPSTGKVTMMLHAFVGPTADLVLETVRGPFTAYLRSHVALLETLVKSLGLSVDIRDPKLLDGMAAFAFERYHRSNALIGTPASAMAMLDRLREAGVDEVACLIDFGVSTEDVLAGLVHLDELRRMQLDPDLLLARTLAEHLDERLPVARPEVRFEIG